MSCEDVENIFFAFDVSVSVYFCSGLDEGLPCSYFHDTTGLTEAQRIERYKYYHVLMLTSILFQEFFKVLFY